MTNRNMIQKKETKIMRKEDGRRYGKNERSWESEIFGLPKKIGYARLARTRERPRDRETERQRERKTDRLIGRQTDRQAGRLTDRRRDSQTERLGGLFI